MLVLKGNVNACVFTIRCVRERVIMVVVRALGKHLVVCGVFDVSSPLYIKIFKRRVACVNTHRDCI